METKTPNETIIAEGTCCKGVVTSDCPLTVSGTIDGELTAPAAVVTGTGSLHGKIRVQELSSDGEVAGDIEANTLRLSGRVGDKTRIRAQSLEVRLDAAGGKALSVAFGSATLEVGPEPGQDQTPTAAESDAEA